jgi:uncharacterized protein (TIGR02996 family)
MNEALLKAFLDDCKAHPDDDTRRLILADWLEEHGDTDADLARATLIRVQCQMETLDEDDPQYDALEKREAQLIDTYTSNWAGQFLPSTAGVQFERGLVVFTRSVRVLCDADWYATCQDIAWDWIEALDLSGNYERREPLAEEDLARVLASPPARCLTNLELYEAGLSPETARTLATWSRFGELRELGFWGCDLTDEIAEILVRAPQLGPLRRLMMNDGQLSSSSLELILRDRRLLHLRDLALGWNLIDHAALPHLANAIFRPRLERLDLHANPLLDRGVEILAGIDLPAFTGLSLGGTGMTPVGAEHLSRASWLPRLRSLDLTGTDTLGPGILTLLAAPVEALRELHFPFTSIDPDHLEQLVACPHLGGLQKLWLHHDDLGPDHIARLPRAWRLESVYHLDLHLNPIGDAGARHLAAWPGLRQLKALDLGYCGLSDAGLQALLSSPYLDSRTRILLTRNQFSEALQNSAKEQHPGLDFTGVIL